MSDMMLIDANVLTRWLESVLSNANPLDRKARAAFSEVQTRVKTMPDIDAVPVVHARWVHEQRYGDSGSWVWRCSACRREAISPIISALKYCHSCGAKMDGGAADV